MEAAPPSYEKATLIDLWDIIARYIPSNDLCSAALVCSRWHATFTPHLWGNPASHFGIDDDHVYVALTKFKRTLQTARLLLRSQTHTLHLPPAHPEIYNGPHATWLRDILDRLPNLQSLIVRGLPFFDYSALQALKYKRPSLTSENELPSGVFELPASPGTSFRRPADFIPSFGLRLLDASRCSNVTASSLAQALRRFEGLLYLDLSYTLPARDLIVFQALRRFQGLQVLKLRGIGMNDDLLKVLAPSIAQRVRSLDIRNNLITDYGVRALLDQCFTTTVERNDPYACGQRSPALLSYLGHEMLKIYQGEDFEGFIRNTFTLRFIGRMAIEDAPDGGITHLYISANPISVEGVTSLLRSGRLHVLDAEPASQDLKGALQKLSCSGTSLGVKSPGVENLIPILATYACDGLKFLRIDHTLITKSIPTTVTSGTVQSYSELEDMAMAPVPDPVEVDGTSVFVEAEGTPVATQTFELSTEQKTQGSFRSDSKNDSVVLPPIILPSDAINKDVSVKDVRRGSAFAPEVVVLHESEPCNIHNANASIAPGSSLLASSMNPRPLGRPRSYSSVADDREARLHAHTSTVHSLHPAMLPHLRTLILTDIPPHSPTPELSNRLINFIRLCATESHLARQQARLDYSIPPGRLGHASALKHSAEKFFALKRIVLELAEPVPNATSRRASQWQHAATKSVTEDHDSETLWSAAATDFSFFGIGDEEDAYPSLDTGRFANRFASREKEIVDEVDLPSAQAAQAPRAKFDNIALLSAFRKERKTAHERAVAAGMMAPDTEGYWDGAIEVVRPSSRGKDSVGDYHSTRFNSGRFSN